MAPALTVPEWQAWRRLPARAVVGLTSGAGAARTPLGWAVVEVETATSGAYLSRLARYDACPMPERGEAGAFPAPPAFLEGAIVGARATRTRHEITAAARRPPVDEALLDEAGWVGVRRGPGAPFLYAHAPLAATLAARPGTMSLDELHAAHVAAFVLGWTHGAWSREAQMVWNHDGTRYLVERADRAWDGADPGARARYALHEVEFGTLLRPVASFTLADLGL